MENVPRLWRPAKPKARWSKLPPRLKLGDSTYLNLAAATVGHVRLTRDAQSSGSAGFGS